MVLLFIDAPQVGNKFRLALLVRGFLNRISYTLYLIAIKISDLSIVALITTFSSLFLLITSPLIVGGFPQLLNIIGVLLIVYCCIGKNNSQRKKISKNDC
ncbi:MAG: hypothetical protein MGF17_06760 [Trichodesmium sp. MAG_R04]|nr:hypothetical protein [Trichodesmium sp. MAG_R04]